ncbi:Uncharacterised protein [Bordetella pertussis]|nr:Uncharacterised protein [Bordetella pertussis]
MPAVMSPLTRRVPSKSMLPELRSTAGTSTSELTVAPCCH